MIPNGDQVTPAVPRKPRARGDDPGAANSIVLLFW